MNWKLNLEGQELVLKNLGLVKRIVRRKFHNRPENERDDLIQEGNIGLMWAASNYIRRKNTGDKNNKYLDGSLRRFLCSCSYDKSGDSNVS